MTDQRFVNFLPIFSNSIYNSHLKVLKKIMLRCFSFDMIGINIVYSKKQVKVFLIGLSQLEGCICVHLESQSKMRCIFYLNLKDPLFLVWRFLFFFFFLFVCFYHT